jgi:hypothetical protein
MPELTSYYLSTLGQVPTRSNLLSTLEPTPARTNLHLLFYLKADPYQNQPPFTALPHGRSPPELTRIYFSTLEQIPTTTNLHLLLYLRVDPCRN